MARTLGDLEREISKLSDEDKERLIEFLMAEVGPTPANLRELFQEFGQAVDGMNESLAATLEYLDGFEDRLEQTAIRAREDVLRSNYRWPFPEPPTAEPN